MNQVDKIKKLLDNSILFTDEQKEAWLKLLPNMTESETSELEGILMDEVAELKKEGFSFIDDPELEKAIDAPQQTQDHGASIEALKAMASKNAPAANNAAFAQELKREVSTPELRKPTPEELGPEKKPAPIAPKPVVAVKPMPTKAPMPPIAPKLAPLPKELQVPHAPLHTTEPIPAGALRSLIEIRTVDDLKKIRALNLRQGELTAQIDLIKAKIVSIAQANKLLPFYTVSAFEQSPLYKVYLQIGSQMIADTNPDRSQVFEKAASGAGTEKLTMREFEAIADLRKQIEQL